jgi:hypothetical protein
MAAGPKAPGSGALTLALEIDVGLRTGEVSREGWGRAELGS